MRIYQHKTSLLTSAGSTSTTTLSVIGGLLRHLVVQALTDTTVFRVNMVDENNTTVMNWGFSRGELNETGIAVPVSGKYVLNITNASPNDTFKVVYSVQE
jgi:hypothetical protein